MFIKKLLKFISKEKLLKLVKNPRFYLIVLGIAILIIARNVELKNLSIGFTGNSLEFGETDAGLGGFSFGLGGGDNGGNSEPSGRVQTKYTACRQDDDCKLIFSNCDCDSVNFKDPRDILEESQSPCRVNLCIRDSIKAVCENKVCIKKIVR